MELLDKIILGLLLVAWAVERVQYFVKHRNAIVRRLIFAVKSPEHAKEIVKRSPEGKSSLLNQLLDKEKPKTDGTRRVSRKRAVGRVLLNLLPFISRGLRL